ncbi:MAG: hypothetical protein KGZ82_01160 [Bacteroidales bacterium]|nr:hypothetical protein [Bacteroidales bacterium]
MRIAAFVLLLLSSTFLTVHAQPEKSIRLFKEADTCHMKKIDPKVTVGSITLHGNKVTRDNIIFREMEFRHGDTLDESEFCKLAKKSRLNLLNLSIFNFVTVDTVHDAANREVIHIDFTFIERWYLWPLPIFELADRNFNAWFNSGKYNRINYGMLLTHNNFRGRREQLRVLIRAGYNQNLLLRYDFPYLSRDQTFGLGFIFGFSRSHETAYKTVNDKQVYYKPASGYAREDAYAAITLHYRPAFRNIHSLTIGLDSYHFADSLLLLNPGYVMGSDSYLKFLSVSYLFKHDYRDYKPYPLTGHYFDVEFAGRQEYSDVKSPFYYAIKTTFDVYLTITKRWFWASNVTSRFSSKTQQPYFMSNTFGFNNDFVRSYELYVIEGQDWGLMKNNLKFALLPTRVGKISGIRSEKFNKIHYACYINLFTDLGFVKRPQSATESTLNNALLVGSGVGLDFVTYYDLVFRLEYGINHRGEKGLFIHFVAPI